MFDMRDVGVDHECDQVENEVRALAEDGEGGEAVLFEARVVHRLDAAHGVDHLLADLDGRSEWFGVTSEDVAKIDWRSRCKYGERKHAMRCAPWKKWPNDAEIA